MKDEQVFVVLSRVAFEHHHTSYRPFMQLITASIDDFLHLLLVVLGGSPTSKWLCLCLVSGLFP